MSASALPPLYARWVEPVLHDGLPEETEATCSSCAMCPEDGETPGPLHFSPRLKCCTYDPELPNFLVGAILDDADASGRAHLEQTIEDGERVTPLGIQRPRTQELFYQLGVRDAFGRSESLLCPYYQADSGECGIWRHRNAVCSTWFCKHVHGHTGQRLWRRVRRFLAEAEKALARHCLLEVGFDLDAMAAIQEGPSTKAPLTRFEIDHRADRALRAQWWGAHLGREQELYRACAQVVRGLDADTVLRVGGSSLRVAAALLGHADRQRRVRPERLQLAALHLQPEGADRWRIETYSPLDTLSLPRELVDLLVSFDGREVEEVVRAVSEEHDVEIDRALIDHLFDFGVLVQSD